MLSGMLLSDCDFVAVDLETTGCKPGRNSIIEIGAVRFRADRILERFERLVRPTEPIPRAVEDLTGITTTMVAHAELIDGAIQEFREFAHDAVLVAHNYRFDLSFLDHEADIAWGEPFPRPTIDTLSLMRRLRPEFHRFSLGSLADALGTATTPDHRAGNDAQATAEILQAVLPWVAELGIRTVGELAAFSGLDRQSDLAARLALTRRIPDEPGVYALRGHDGRVIFVGRAKSLRLRTRSYFYPNGGDDALAHEVADITAIRACSQLDAALLERRLIDRHDPPYNPAAHRSREAYVLVVDPGSPYPGLKVAPTPRRRGRMIGPFTSRWAAQILSERIAEVYGLRRCARRLDPRLALTQCDHRDAGSCPAPCVTTPDRGDYAARVDAALAVFANEGPFRAHLTVLQQDAASQARYEDAIRYRDGLRALDRALSTLRTVTEASSRDVILVEEHDGDVVLHLLRGGLRAAVLRGTRETVEPKIARAVERVYYSSAERVDPFSLTPAKLGELLTVASFEAADGHLEVPVTDRTETVARVRRALGLDRRTPRRRHGSPAGA